MALPTELAEQLAALGTKPVSSGAGAGESARDDPRYSEVRDEIGKLQLPSKPALNWKMVEEQTLGLLAEKSKDLMIASFLCASLLQRHGFLGLAAGIDVCANMIQTFGNDLYPKSAKGRRNALEWLSEQAPAGIRSFRASPDDEELLERCVEGISKLDSLVLDWLDDDSVSFRELQISLGETKGGLQAPEPLAPPTPPPMAEEARTATLTVKETPAPQAVESTEDVEPVLSRLRETARNVAGVLFDADPTDPRSYRIARAVSWMQLTDLPSNSNGNTQFPGPEPQDTGERLQESLDKGEFETVLREAEGRFSSSILWLDIHRFVAESMTGLGSSYNAAQESVVGEFASLVRRLPGLLDLRFRNSVPFADELTKSLADQETASPAGDEPSALRTPQLILPGKPSQAAIPVEVTAKISRLAKKGKLEEAMEELAAGTDEAKLPRERSMWHLHMARACLEAKRFNLATAQFETLDETLQKTQIEEWEPEFGLVFLSSYIECINRLAKKSKELSGEMGHRTRKLLARMSRIDPQAALRSDGK